MASFVPPLAGNLADVTAVRPTRAELDDSGHRAIMISRLSNPAGLSAVAPIRSYARPIEIKGEFANVAVPTGAGRFRFVELSPLPSPTEASGILRTLGEAGATMPTFYFGGPGLDPLTPSGTVTAGDEIVAGQTVLIGAMLGPCALAPREWARVLLEAMTRAGEPDLGPWTAFLNTLGNEPALYVLRHTGQPPIPNQTQFDQMQFDVELANGVTDIVTVDERGDLAAVVEGDLFAPGGRVRLRTRVRRDSLPQRLRLRRALVRGAAGPCGRALVRAVSLRQRSRHAPVHGPGGLVR